MKTPKGRKKDEKDRSRKELAHHHVNNCQDQNVCVEAMMAL